MNGEELKQIVIDFNANKVVKINGWSYRRSANEFSFHQAVRNLIERGEVESITVPLVDHQDYIGNIDIGDLQCKANFTVGRGKVRYLLMIWHSSGACTVYPVDTNRTQRYLNGDEIITIHFN